MAKVIIAKELLREIHRRFTEHDADTIIDRMEEYGNQPHQGKPVGQVQGILIKELKYDKWRFYCITDGHTVKFGTADELAALLIKFVKMSEKKDQQQAIDQIKETLRSMGFEGF